MEFFNDCDNGICHGKTELGYIPLTSLINWFLYYKQCRNVILEISATKVLPESQLDDHWGYNFRSLINYIEQSLNGINGFVRDSITGEPLKAKVVVENHDIIEDSSFVFSGLPYGDYYRPIIAGTYEVTFSCEGYITKTITNVSVANNAATKLDVEMKPINITDIIKVVSPNTFKGSFGIVPNPVDKSISKRISFYITTVAEVKKATVNVYDAVGNELFILNVNRQFNTNRQHLLGDWDLKNNGKAISGGNYLVVLRIVNKENTVSVVKRMIGIKDQF